MQINVHGYLPCCVCNQKFETMEEWIAHVEICEPEDSYAEDKR